jgi:hypothetical protein
MRSSYHLGTILGAYIVTQNSAFQIARRKSKMWDKMKMVNAVKAIKRKEMGFKETPRVFEVPRSTRKDKINSMETAVEKLTNTQLGRKPELPYKFEEETVS